jgi:glutathione S-transferase
MMRAALTVLDNHLQTREYLLGRDFMIADLNVASILMVGIFTMTFLGVQFELSGTPTVEKWFKKCTDREALERVRGMK